jgi:hypothetical protein
MDLSIYCATNRADEGERGLVRLAGAPNMWRF